MSPFGRHSEPAFVSLFWSGEFFLLEHVTEKHFDTTFGANVRGMLFTVQKALPLLNDGASVILTGSTAAGSGGEAFGVYAASKAAVRSFSRTWANELKHRKIRVDTLVPGPIATPGTAGLAPNPDEAAKLWDFFASRVPLGRMGRPDEAAAAALFLAGDQSSFVTGTELFVDGGLNQISPPAAELGRRTRGEALGHREPRTAPVG
ncbi:enoyl-ACP reductase-like protein [Saccharopolyspora erythraea NRRL 2338]|uniref:Short-chain dehydrogenase/reductase SDR n=2 Tax=Saccharopolyspora erythraea TaxID=1836 RepID=A0ABN1DDP3_SACER|nr:SDR family oxidoreductase [Saccharopolyspora erythraea]PFG97696.1 enoyl-ACP reductase-like protein [Saccharopolyspora erythraea NRRL 2338]